MKSSEDSSIFDELNDRLDDFFDDDEGRDSSGGDGEAAPASPEKGTALCGKDPGVGSTGLDRIKAIMLEMEWEISDENIDGFLTEVAKLAAISSGDRVVVLFLKLLSTMGQYIKAKKASANPEYILFFKNLFASFCRVVEELELPTRERNALLLEAVENFKVFKSRVVPGYTPSPAVALGKRSPVPDDKYAHLSDDIKRYVRDTIKAELSARMG